MDTHGPLDSWTLKNKAIFVLSFILLSRISQQNYYRNSCTLSFSEYIEKCFRDLLLAKQSSRDSFSTFFGSSMLNSLRRLPYFSSRFLIRSADDKIIGRSISAAEYARATSLILLYPLTEIP